MGNRHFTYFFVYCLIFSFAVVTAQDFKQSSDGFFIIETASKADEAYLAEVFAIVQQAKRDLHNDWGFKLKQGVVIRVHPNISSYSQATQMPWYFAALAKPSQNKIDIQRLRVLVERDSLETTLRHELFHLGQPDDWPRWQAEGSAMLFAQERPKAELINDISEQELNYLLLNASSQKEIQRANATALAWVKELKKEKTD